MYNNRVYYCIGVLAALSFFSFYTLWHSTFVLLFVLALPLLSLLLSIIPASRIKYKLFAPTSAKPGEKFCVLIADRSSCSVPCYYIELFAPNASDDDPTWIAKVSAGESYVIEMYSEHCRAVKVSVSKASVTDYLGLFRFRLAKAPEKVVYIMPEPVKPVPEPELSSFSSPSFHPKYGGGFSEVHDLRDYRPGDSMRDIHWKLSSKTDRLIVREPIVPDHGAVVITLDILPPSDEMDSVFGQLLWISSRLAEHEIHHEVRYIDPETLKIVSIPVNNAENVTAMMQSVLSVECISEAPSILDTDLGKTGWRYHIKGGVTRS